MVGWSFLFDLKGQGSESGGEHFGRSDIPEEGRW